MVVVSYWCTKIILATTESFLAINEGAFYSVFAHSSVLALSSVLAHSTVFLHYNYSSLSVLIRLYHN